ncbi:unnamed protein product [Ixodes pacificus]
MTTCCLVGWFNQKSWVLRVQPKRVRLPSPSLLVSPVQNNPWKFSLSSFPSVLSPPIRPSRCRSVHHTLSGSFSSQLHVAHGTEGAPARGAAASPGVVLPQRPHSSSQNARPAGVKHTHTTQTHVGKKGVLAST